MRLTLDIRLPPRIVWCWLHMGREPLLDAVSPVAAKYRGDLKDRKHLDRRRELVIGEPVSSSGDDRDHQLHAPERLLVVLPHRVSPLVDFCNDANRVLQPILTSTR